MTIIEYVENYLPKYFGVNKIFGKIVGIIIETEKINPSFSIHNFKNARERATLAIPYQIKSKKKRERVLNILELILLIHRKEYHKEDYEKRIKYLKKKTKLTKEESDMIQGTRGFWSG